MRVYFFFSSRRRHTRSDRDWSSDVCSSDLGSMAGRFEGLSDLEWRLFEDIFPPAPPRRGGGMPHRSEKRRVGEKGRSRGAPDHLKKKKIKNVRTPTTTQ